MATIGKFDFMEVDGYSPPRLQWPNPSKNYYVKALVGNGKWNDNNDRQCRFIFFNDEDTKNIISGTGTGEINVQSSYKDSTRIKDKPKSPSDMGKPWQYASSHSIYTSFSGGARSEHIVETNHPKVYCKLYEDAKRREESKGDKEIVPWITGQVENGFKFTGDWNLVDCDIPKPPPQCVIPPSIDELLNQTGKKLYVIAKAKPSLHHQLYLFNPSLDDIVYSKEGDMTSKITALKNVPKYSVFDCKWRPAGTSNLRFSDCYEDICENKNNVLANGLDQLIKDKIGKIQSGNPDAFLAEKFPTCCASYDKDSTLVGPIDDLLNQYGKTFYLLGKKAGGEPKLYLFDLGQVQGGVQYTHILEAVVLKQVDCKWVEDNPLRQNLKFSELEGEVDTNFYLLKLEQLVKPSKITSITHRKANQYLLKYFPTCSIKKPEDGGDPNDNLTPDFGNGGSGGIGGSGGEGFFPETDNPLPNPQVPPCSGGDGGSKVPVSQIWLISAPELKPSYADTYDFKSAKAQQQFFINKKSFKVDNYSYLRKDNAIQVGSHVDNLHCYNYLMYRNKFDKWYYCFIMDKQYINERTTRLIIATDVIQTYLFDYVLAPCYVERCHVDRWESDGKTPTPEYEPEGLEFGEPVQVSWTSLDYQFDDTYIAVCSNPLGVIPSRSTIRKPPTKKGVEEDGL